MTGTPGDGGAAVGGGVAPGDQLRGGQREVGGHPAPAAAASSLHRQSKASRAATNHQRSFHIRGEGPYCRTYMLTNPMFSLVFLAAKVVRVLSVVVITSPKVLLQL